MAAPAVILLGPQRSQPTVGEVVAELGLRGPLGLVTAGWQEREPEDEELRRAIGCEAVNLEVYARCERVLAAEPDLAAAIRARQRALRELQELYRLRLNGAMGSARALLARGGRTELLEPEQESAVETVRQLDRHHLGRVAQLHRETERAQEGSRPSTLVRARSEVAQLVHDMEAVLIAGGHVAVLRNRLDLLCLGPELRHKPVIAWSAGAMVVCERIVLFHDNPPQGPGHAELLDRGLGLAREVLPLPHAGARLSLGDPLRVALFARRFEDLTPVLLEPCCRLDWQPPHWRPAKGTQVLRSDGTVAGWPAQEAR